MINLTFKQVEFIKENKGILDQHQIAEKLGTTKNKLWYAIKRFNKSTGEGIFNVYERKNWLIDEGAAPKQKAIEIKNSFGQLG